MQITDDTTLITADSTSLTADDGLPVSGRPYYLDLITSYHRGKARFVQTVAASVNPFADAQGVSTILPEAFDLDTAIGAQLDVDGEWIGRSRFVPVPAPSVFFALGSATLGFGYGFWKGPYDTTYGLSRLPDPVYRRLLKAKALANRWDGLSDGLAAILDAYFDDPAVRVFVDDAGVAVKAPRYFTFGDPTRGFGSGVWLRRTFAFGDPHNGFGYGNWRRIVDQQDRPRSLGLRYRVVIAGKIPPKLDLAVLSNSLLPVEAMGARVSYLVTTVDGSPVFGFGAQSNCIAGFGIGAWGNTPDAVAALAA